MRKRINGKQLVFVGIFLLIFIVLLVVFIISGALTKKVDESKSEDEIAMNEEPSATEVVEELYEVHEGGNCTEKYGKLMLINPNFRVTTDWIDNRKNGLISLYATYGIKEGNSWNGDNLIDAEAGEHLNEMVKAYEAYNTGHTMVTNSCYRARGTKCGRLCLETGTSDHHAGYTCDLIDPQYGETLDTDYLSSHIEWQWLKENSYKYGFIDRFPEEWAGGSMSEPLNVDENGTTGLYETWHYRYVGIEVATEIATGKYNDGKYDSLEHYLKATNRVEDLKNGICK